MRIATISGPPANPSFIGTDMPGNEIGIEPSTIPSNIPINIVNILG